MGCNDRDKTEVVGRNLLPAPLRPPKNLTRIRLASKSHLCDGGADYPPGTLRAIPAVAQLLAGPPVLDRSKGRRQTKRDTKN
jgi:hypothetical protein